MQLHTDECIAWGERIAYATVLSVCVCVCVCVRVTCVRSCVCLRARVYVCVCVCVLLLFVFVLFFMLFLLSLHMGSHTVPCAVIGRFTCISGRRVLLRMMFSLAGDSPHSHKLAVHSNILRSDLKRKLELGSHSELDFGFRFEQLVFRTL